MTILRMLIMKISIAIVDKSVLEVINLGIASHNPKNRVSSNVPTSNIIIPAVHLKTQYHLEKISD